MLIIAVGLTVALVAVDLLDLASRKGAQIGERLRR
jgi:hypothetical protein